MTEIHPSAVVDPSAEIAESVTIGPYCVVGPDVVLADKVVLHSHVVVTGRTKIGAETEIYPFASIGHPPQDLKYAGEPSELVIGERNRIREYTTAHPGTAGGGMITRVGNDCLLMIGVHIAHDCQIGNHVIMANNASLGGHVIVGDHAVFGALAGVHQFTRIGDHAMIGGLSAVVQDVIPYGSVIGDRAHLAGLNITGLKRRGFSRDDIHALRTAYRLLFAEEGTKSERLADVGEMYSDNATVMEIVGFMSSDSHRGICQPHPDQQS
ncbi:MAG: acyl-ACP--UDP-N-acetylglucosamine O-acyltransferase [Alphaproteobacteria bacterium]|nr:acyl-ACP--UDP-N-acetylglucosamine O-acyltransferase [Alphaproteobacteria bacterium]